MGKAYCKFVDMNTSQRSPPDRVGRAGQNFARREATRIRQANRRSLIGAVQQELRDEHLQSPTLALMKRCVECRYETTLTLRQQAGAELERGVFSFTSFAQAWMFKNVLAVWCD